MNIRIYFLALICLLEWLSLAGQNRADDIVGYYYCTDPFTKEASQNQIYKAVDGTYEGKVVWVANPELRHHVNLVFLTGLKFNAKENEWEDGKLIYPGKNGVYKTYMSLLSPTQLKVRGYWGMAVLGKTVYWTKEKMKR
jgi:uncharacterized protein (DUF2147 family)